jgi:radical SAM superfamily enzyme YgiQ (UPF0313 family)
MALDYLAHVLREEGWCVAVADVDVSGEAAYFDLLRAGTFDLVGITAMSIQVDEANALARAARELAPAAVLLRGGAHDTYSYREGCETHRELYDAFVVGEGEETLREIVRVVERGTFFSERERIQGLAFWDSGVKFTGRRHQGDVNKHVPFRLTHHTSYNFDVFGFRKTAQVLSARGCENACFYCSESVDFHGRREFRRTIESMRHEFRALRADGYEAVYFDDPTFTRKREWVQALCEELGRAGFIWGCNTRVDCLDDELVERMSQAGCKYLFCGLESAAPEVLRAMNKTSDPSSYLESAIRSYAALRRHEIPCSAFLIFGCPRMEKIDGRSTFAPEHERDVLMSLEFAVHTLDPDYLSMNILRLLPGIPFSFAPQFACIRPTGGAPIHGGYYDSTWYLQTDCRDLRSTHPIFRAFEGCRSVNPPHMTPERCYEILSLGVEMVNAKNATPGKRNTKIVVDTRFTRFLKEEWRRGARRYTLSTFADIEQSEPGEATVNHAMAEEVISIL